MLEGRGVDLFMVETFFDLDELETALAAVRSVSSLPIVALLTFDADGETLAGVTPEEAGGAAAPARLRRVRREPRRRAGRGADGARAHAGRRRRARGAPERRPREHVRPANRLPARNARVLQRVRRAGARARRARDRRLLRNDAGADRGDPRGGRRGAAPDRFVPRPPARDGDAAGARRGGDAARAQSSARASSSSPSRSIRRSARIPRRSSRRRAPSATRAARSSSTSTTTRARGRG